MISGMRTSSMLASLAWCPYAAILVRTLAGAETGGNGVKGGEGVGAGRRGDEIPRASG